MDRRTLLATTVSVVGLSLSGCLSRRAQPRDHPEIPDPLTAETAREFVEAYAEVELHNAALSDRTTEISIGCDGVHLREMGDGFYALANCGGSKVVREGFTSEAVGEIDVHLFPLFVDERRVVTIGRTRIESRDPPRNRDEATYGFRVLNFADEEYDVTAAVSAADELLLEDSYVLEDVAGARHDTVVGEPGTYEFEIALDGMRSERYEWEYTDRDERTVLVACVSPNGDLLLDELPDR